jgi:hypothetical protein
MDRLTLRSSIMTYRGHVKQGVIVLDPPAQLPEGAEVEVRASDRTSAGTDWAEADSRDDEALVSGSVAAAMAVLPREDFSDWKK